MTLKHIRIFVTVYQEESITRAAEKLHMTQPATSLAIREMEEYYHTKLFERSGRGIRVTSAGTRLYPSAARLLSLYDEMDAEMKNWDTSGRLRIGSSISIGSCILPQLINRFSKKYPELELYVKVDSSDVIEQNILENHLDFALIEGSVHSEKLNSSVFLDDELVPVCSRFHPLAGAEDIEELFGLRAAADRPETAADASGHDDAVSVVVHMLFAVLSYNITAFYRDNQTGSP